MRFDIYGRFKVEVQREEGRWAIYKLKFGVSVCTGADIEGEGEGGSVEFFGGNR